MPPPDPPQPLGLRRAVATTRPSIRESWFDREPRRSLDMLIDAPPPQVRVGHPAWSTLAGMLAGGVGGAAALVSVAHVARRMRLDVDLASLVGNTLPPLSTVAPKIYGAVVVVLASAAIGALFGRLTRRLFNVAARVLFALVVASAGWVVMDALVLGRFAPALAHALPFVPMLAGVVAFSVCVGVVPPIRRSRRSDDV